MSLDQGPYGKFLRLFPGLPPWQRRAAILLSLAFAIFILAAILLMIALLIWNPTT
jgi:hypothetical protein